MEKRIKANKTPRSRDIHMPRI